MKEVYQNAVKLSEETARELTATEGLDSEKAQVILQRSLGKLLHRHARSLRRNLFSQPGINNDKAGVLARETLTPINIS